MAMKVLSIEIGYSLTRICEVDYKVKNPKVYSCFTVPTPQGALDDGVLNVSDSMINFIRKGMRENGVRTRKAVFTITSTKIASREVMLPFIKNEKRVGDMVAANMSEYFPVDLTQYHIAHNIISTVTNDKEEKFFKVNVLATPNRVIDGYKQLAKACNLQIVSLDYIGNSLNNMVSEECGQGNKLIVKIDEKATMITAMQSGVTVLQRSIPYGVDEVISSAAQANQYNSKMSYEQLVDVLCQQRFIQNSFSDGDNITESLRALVGGVARVIDYYNSKNGSDPIEQMVLTGLGAKFIGMSDLMGHELGFETAVLNEVKKVHSGKALRNKNLGLYIGVIGAAIKPLNFVPAVKGLEDTSVTKEESKVPVILFVGSILVAFAMTAMSVLPYMAEKDANESNKREIEALKPVEQVYSEYKVAEAKNIYLNELDKKTVNYNDNFVALIEELEEKMPATFSTNGITSTVSTVSMSFRVANKTEAAKVLILLKDFDSITNVSANSITEVTQDNGATYHVEMSVVATYGEKVTETEESAEE